jgi:PAS domain S-box-containing protein
MKKTTPRKSHKTIAEIPKERAAKSPKGSPFPIAGIGASAGGLEALEHFLRNVPEGSGIAFVVVQHLDPSHKGLMTELLQRATPMKVFQVKDRMRVKPDCVYVIPPNRDMSILHGVLHLFEPTAHHGLRLPIDFFLRSLAEDRKEQSIGVILTGMGCDGTLGLRAIKEKAGLAVAQDPDSAKFDSMPRSAIDAGMVDLVAPVEELPGRIMNYIQHPIHVPAPGSAMELEALSSLEKIVILLREQTGNDFSVYKKNTLYRRIERRMGIHQIGRIGAYVHYLRENPHERELLFKELLIGVTSFFRDAEAWKSLKNEAIPSLIANRPSGYSLRVWVPGCSTGEEAYSLAIVFQEALEKMKDKGKFTLQIFATDLDQEAIEKARLGFFSENIAADVTPERLKRFFVRENGGYRVNKVTREMVIFALQNITKDPPFTRLDLISCRNLLIYLTPETQKKLIPLFHYSLNPDGVLFLGNAETIGSFTDLFSQLEREARIYRCLASSLSARPVEFPTAFTLPRTDLSKEPAVKTPPVNLQVLAEQLVLKRYSPSTVLVSDKGDILFITGRTGRYLEPAAGKANLNIFAMARDELRYHLTSLFQKAVRDKGSASLHAVEVKTEGGARSVDLTVEYLNEPESLRGAIMVVFTDVPAPLKTRARRGIKPLPADTAHVGELEWELQEARRELQLTLEEMQTSQEELKATNEELQSTNEELQSTNEELTTSKEELQSLNEELQTVNAEQTAKVDELLRVNSDLKNLLDSTEVATVFLDNSLQIRRFTSGTDKLFKLRAGDVGRPLSEIASDLVYEDLSGDAREVLRTLAYSEKQVATRDGRWFRVRIMPYRTLEDKIDGLVITFVDMTEARQLEAKLRASESALSSLVDSAPSVIVCLSPEGHIIEFNREAVRVHGRTRVESAGRKYFDLFVPEPMRERTAGAMFRALSGEPVQGLETTVAAGDGERVIRWSINRMVDPAGQITGIMAIGTDITGAKNPAHPDKDRK